jgi:ATP/maltotriose-dependent transcriptional regulator MalT
LKIVPVRNTIKSAVPSVYRKPCVSTRGQAVSRSRELRFLAG